MNYWPLFGVVIVVIGFVLRFNPVLVVEVLSESTSTYDLTRKFQAYQTIPGLLYYLLLDSQQVNAMLYTREFGSLAWTLRTYDQLTDHQLTDDQLTGDDDEQS